MTINDCVFYYSLFYYNVNLLLCYLFLLHEIYLNKRNKRNFIISIVKNYLIH